MTAKFTINTRTINHFNTLIRALIKQGFVVDGNFAFIIKRKFVVTYEGKYRTAKRTFHKTQDGDVRPILLAEFSEMISEGDLRSRPEYDCDASKVCSIDFAEMLKAKEFIFTPNNFENMFNRIRDVGLVSHEYRSEWWFYTFKMRYRNVLRYTDWGLGNTKRNILDWLLYTMAENYEDDYYEYYEKIKQLGDKFNIPVY